MCGIAGFTGLEDRPLLEAMTGRLEHRGPDASGFFHQSGVGLGSRRLSIIDVEGGNQPIAGESGCVVVFNGEIYNFRELRRELEKSGHRFKTRSDTEVIVHLYEDRGVDALRELSGMFALALWDPREGRLLLARDPLGVKPLYYAVSGSKLYFGSELKALRAVPGLAGRIDLQSLGHYLDYLYVPAPRTIYAGVSKLRSGEWLSWKDGQVDRGVFWRPRPRLDGISREQALRELDSLLRRVVSDQIVSDVPIGLLLSGGLDSSAIAYYLAEAGERPEAFCAYFSSSGERFNEVEKARRIASWFGFPLDELAIGEGIEDGIEALVAALDEPMADSSALPTYWICREARRRLKVALTGIGGDEIFGGYPRYLGIDWFGKYQRLPLPAREALAGIAAGVPDQVSSRNVGSWIRRFLGSGTLPLENAYAAWMGHLSAADRAWLCSDRFREDSTLAPAPLTAFEQTEAEPLQRAMAVDLRTYLPEDLLTHADRVSMAVGLELRVPLCDQRLAEFALGLPSRYRVDGFTLKALLKELLKTRLPGDILSQKKQGFMIPLGFWFKDKLRPLVSDHLKKLGRRGLFRSEGLDELFEEHRRGRRNRTDTLWALVFLEAWFERYHPDFSL